MKRHPRRSDEEWLDIIHECRTSGLPDKTWCEEHHIQTSKFYYHIRRLRAKTCEITERKDTLPQKQESYPPVIMTKRKSCWFAPIFLFLYNKDKKEKDQTISDLRSTAISVCRSIQ